MSRHGSSSSSDTELEWWPTNPANFAIGGVASVKNVGMSNPPPCPPHENEAVGGDLVPAANKGATCHQLKDPSASSVAAGCNTSVPPDIEHPPRIAVDWGTG